MTAAVLAAVALSLLVTLPPSPRMFSLDTASPDLLRRTVRGAYHIHTTRSDGAESKDSVAAAAARAGLQLAIFTDHGDGTRAPDPPQYLHGVLCLDGVEISTNGGHYVALDMGAAPYPLGGEPHAVVEDVERLGGLGIVAHPLHPNQELAWREWGLPVGGIEWLNLDAEWRNESTLAIGRLLFDYLLRPAAAVASVLDRPTVTFTRWDALASSRAVLGLAGADAHGSRMGGLEEGERTFAPGPGYEASFRSVTNRLLLADGLTGDAVADATLVYEALRARRVYTVVDGIADGILLDRGPDGAFTVAAPVPPGIELRPVRQGTRMRLEIDISGAPGNPPMPWVVGNWTGDPRPPQPQAAAPAAVDPLRLGSDWRIEKDPQSTGTVSSGPGPAVVSYGLAPGIRHSQFVAAAADIPDERPIRSLTFLGHAVKPMRVSVQLRYAPDDHRWLRSVYLDPTTREVTVQIGDMVSADRPGQEVPQRGPRSILFVVDLVNAAPGATGAFTISDLRVSR